MQIPPYSPEFNPIGQLWAILKSKVNPTKFSDVATLNSRTIVASEAIPVKTFQRFLQHSVSQFDIFLNKPPIYIIKYFDMSIFYLTNCT